MNTRRLDLRSGPSASHALRGLAIRVVARAGSSDNCAPAPPRHPYAEHIARETDTCIAQHLLGHANLGTTDAYLGRPRLDDMVAAVKDATFGVRTTVLASIRHQGARLVVFA